MPKDKPKQPSKSTKRRPAKNEIEEHLKRTFGDLPVRDAKDDLRIPITQAALKKSVRKDPEHCMFAEAAKEVLGSTAAIFFKTIAAVEVVGEDGVRRVERFEIPQPMQTLIERFDRGLKINTDDSWLVLKAPRKSKRLEAKRRYQRKYEKAKYSGTYVAKGTSREGITAPRKSPLELEVRNGTGQWQMIKKEHAAA